MGQQQLIETPKAAPPVGMEILAENLGPLRGKHHLATIDGPGLWEITGQNTGGKTTLARAMMLFGDRMSSGASAITVSDGELTGSLYMTPGRVVFSTIRPPAITGAESMPLVEEIPSPVDLLITGGTASRRTVKDPNARARNRMAQLLEFAPIDVDDEILARLCMAMEGRPFCDGLTPEREIAWGMLMAQVDVAKFKPVAPMLPGQIREEVLAARAGNGSILGDHETLVKLLNRLATAAGHAVTQQKLTIGHSTGAITELVESSARRSGDSAPSHRARLESWSGDLGALKGGLEDARSAAARVRVGLESKQAEQGRREELREAHGERPDPAPEAEDVEATEKAVEVTGAAVEAATKAWDDARAREISDNEALAEFKGTLTDRWSAWREAVHRVDAVFGSPSGPSEVRVPEIGTTAEMIDRITSPVTEALSSLAFSLGAALGANVTHDQAILARQKMESALAEAVRVDKGAAAELLNANGALRKVEERAAKWDETAALIALDVPGPTQEDVTAADLKVDSVQAEISMGTTSAELLRAIAEHQAEADVLTWLDDLVVDYRESAAAAWVHLGDILTEKLALPWLRIKEQDMVLVYDRDTTFLATAATERPEERLLDDGTMVSTAELHEAMLKLMLDRRKTDVTEAGRSPIIILPWDNARSSVIAPLDDVRKRRFAADVEDAGLTIFAERPRRDGEPEGVRMVKVEPLRAGGEM